MTRHCSDEELQLFAEGQQLPEPGMLQHIETCSSCQEQLAAYRLIFTEIEQQPAVAFDFDLAGTVLSQLQPVKTKVSNYHVYTILPGILIAILVLVTLYIFRNNFLHLSTGISSTFLAASLLACTSIIVFKIIKLYQRYQLQIKKLNYSD